MYENYTQEAILQEMLDCAKESIKDKERMSGMELIEGTLIHNCLAPVAFELQQLYINLDETYNNTFAESAPREELILRAEERGLSPYPASRSIAKIITTPSAIEVPIGTRFSVYDLFFSTIEKISDGVYSAECETDGTVGNVKPGEMTMVDHVDGLESAMLEEILIPGEDEEETESFRNRYFNSFNSVAFGGNRADYREKVMQIRGVGGLNIERATSDDKTVRIWIIGSDMGVPSSTLVELVQSTLDPTQSTGAGDGLAPIGHRVVVTGVTETIVNISTTLTLKNDYEIEDIKLSAEAAIATYLAKLTEIWDGAWDRDESLVVRVAQIESAILSVEGIDDVKSTEINGYAENLTMERTAIPKLGGVSIGTD